MIKNYVIDTNVIIHDPMCFYSFEDNHVIIPIVAVEELDKLKTRGGMVGYHAKMAARELNKLRKTGSLSRGVHLPTGGTLRVEMNHMDMAWVPPGIDTHANDMRILAITRNLQQEHPETPCILVTKDVYLSIRADAFQVLVQDYTNDKVQTDEQYRGYREIYLSTEQINLIFRGGLALSEIREDVLGGEIFPNEFLHIHNADDDSNEVIARYDGSMVVPLQFAKENAWGLQPINREQKMAFELLMHPDIEFVSITGGAGSGKTILSTAVALKKVIEQGVYRKIVFVRPVVAAGNDIGFLPGSEEEKLRPWMGSFYDAIENLLSTKYQKDRDSREHKGQHKVEKPDFTVEDFIETYRQEGMLETKTFTYMRGRTLSNALVIVDEAQELTPHLAKLMLTRAGFGSKFIFLGDPSDNQIDNVLVDARSNGLVYAVEKMKPFPITGHIRLEQVERSPLAKIAEKHM